MEETWIAFRRRDTFLREGRRVGVYSPCSMRCHRPPSASLFSANSSQRMYIQRPLQQIGVAPLSVGIACHGDHNPSLAVCSTVNPYVNSQYIDIPYCSTFHSPSDWLSWKIPCTNTAPGTNLGRYDCRAAPGPKRSWVVIESAKSSSASYEKNQVHAQAKMGSQPTPARYTCDKQQRRTSCATPPTSSTCYMPTGRKCAWSHRTARHMHHRYKTTYVMQINLQQVDIKFTYTPASGHLVPSCFPLGNQNPEWSLSPSEHTTINCFWLCSS